MCENNTSKSTVSSWTWGTLFFCKICEHKCFSFCVNLQFGPFVQLQLVLTLKWSFEKESNSPYFPVFSFLFLRRRTKAQALFSLSASYSFAFLYSKTPLFTVLSLLLTLFSVLASGVNTLASMFSPSLSYLLYFSHMCATLTLFPCHFLNPALHLTSPKCQTYCISQRSPVTDFIY